MSKKERKWEHDQHSLSYVACLTLESTAKEICRQATNRQSPKAIKFLSLCLVSHNSWMRGWCLKTSDVLPQLASPLAQLIDKGRGPSYLLPSLNLTSPSLYTHNSSHLSPINHPFQISSVSLYIPIPQQPKLWKPSATSQMQPARQSGVNPQPRKIPTLQLPSTMKSHCLERRVMYLLASHTMLAT